MLLTKLRVPEAAPQLVLRRRLFACLAGWTAARLILVTAPAGYGKTTLVSSWARREFGLEPARGAAPGPAAVQSAGGLGWITLDESDNDPQQFVRYLAAALQPVIPTTVAAVQQTVAAAQAAPAQAVGALTRSLAQVPYHVLLVLDDFHRIENPAVHELVDLLLATEQSALHCLIASRQTPLLGIGRERARGQLLELNSSDLRFTALEAVQFFAVELHDQALLDQEMADLVERTQGWAISMQLAALVLHERPGARSFTPLPGQEHLADYIAAEVLERLPTAVKRFMLQTAILDELAAPVCAAVTGQPGSADQLAYLAQTLALVTPLNREQQVYRCHDLLRQALLQALAVECSQAEVAELHRRAARWYSESGYIDRALLHYRGAGDESGAAALIEEHCLPALLRGDLQAAERWLAQAPAAARQARPRLALDDAWLSVFAERSDLEEKMARVRVAIAHACPPASPHPWQQELRGLEACEAFMRGDRAAAHESTVQCLAAAAPDESLTLGICHLIQLTLHRLTGPLDVVQQHAAAAAAAFARAGFVLGQLSSLRTLAQCLMEHGKSADAVDTYRRLLRFAQDAGVSQVAEMGGSRILFGALLYQLNQIEEACSQFAAAQALGEVLDDPAWTLWSQLWLARCRRVQNLQLPSGQAPVDEEQLWRRVRAERSHAVQNPVAVASALRWLGEGDAVRAWHAVGAVHFNPTEGPDMGNMTLFTTYVHAYLGRGKSAAALAGVFLRWESYLDANSWSVALKIQFRLAAARLSAALGSHMAAVRALNEGLELIQATGYVRYALDHLAALRPLLLRSSHPMAAQILAAEPDDHVVAPYFTDVELSVLRGVANRLTNKQIAGALWITENTVKFHLKRINRKLGVAGREEALARGRELGIL